MSEKYDGRVQFICVYIKEIHAHEDIPNFRNIDDGIKIKQPENDDERAENAGMCMLRYNFRFPILLDNMTNEVEGKYASLPERLYLIGADGKIALTGGPGPHYFDGDELEEAIIKELA